MKSIIIAVSEKSLEMARLIGREIGGDAVICSKEASEGCVAVGHYDEYLKANWRQTDAVIIIGAMGICVRSIAPALENKYEDPAVVCIDSAGRFVIPVVSGHVGGANDLARRIAGITGGEAVVTTQSDGEGLWALDTLARRFGWRCEADHDAMNRAIFSFVNKRPTVLLLECRDAGTDYLERSCPEHVKIVYDRSKLDLDGCELLVAVTARTLPDIPKDMATLTFHPAVLHLGFGCRKQCDPRGIPQFISEEMLQAGFSPMSLKSISTIDLKKDEPLLEELQKKWPKASVNIYTTDKLRDIAVPNPSQKAFEVTGCYGVSEGSALKASGQGQLLIEKQKCKLTEGNDFTFALAGSSGAIRAGHIEIVGAGPGDPELVSVRGKRFLEQADLILYAGSLVPVELTYYAKSGATVRSSASMNLEEQFALMKDFYDRGGLVVRLHTGDPCIYGAIQEQMAFFDRYGMSYHITPGISAFQAAAAALRSQFTIPEKVQTIILTRGEGRTPMPEREQLHKLAQSRSTMCIYLSAAIAEQVQAELMQEYPPETPVAACYKLTWKEERIYRGQLKDLAAMVRDNHLTLTTLLVVGDAIDNREGLSRLYADEFKHLFRK